MEVGVEVGVGLKHRLCLVTEGTNDIGVLSQCAKKHAVQTDAAVEEGVTCSFLFLLGCLFASSCLPSSSSCLLRCAGRATHETPFLHSVPMS